MRTITLENRAGRGIRLEQTEPLVVGTHQFHYSVLMHIPIGKFMVGEEVTHLERREGNTTVHPTYGGAAGFYDTVDQAVKAIERARGVRVVVLDRKAVKREEAYAISERRRVVGKYPSWRTEAPATHFFTGDPTL